MNKTVPAISNQTTTKDSRFGSFRRLNWLCTGFLAVFVRRCLGEVVPMMMLSGSQQVNLIGSVPLLLLVCCNTSLIYDSRSLHFGTERQIYTNDNRSKEEHLQIEAMTCNDGSAGWFIYFGSRALYCTRVVYSTLVCVVTDVSPRASPRNRMNQSQRFCYCKLKQ